MRVRVFGLVVDSEVPLDGCPPAGSGAPALRIRRAPPRGRGVVPVRIPGVGRFLISADGRSMGARPETGADPALFRRNLLDQAIPRALGLQGRPVLHASAVAGPRGAILFLGPTGTGKSTAALRRALRGAPLLADDGVRLDLRAGKVWAHGAHPGIRVRRDILRTLPAPLRAAAVRGGGKWTFDARRPPFRWVGAALPVERIVLLGRVPGPLTPGAKVRALLEGTFRADPADGAAFEGALLVCAAVARTVRIARHGVRA